MELALVVYVVSVLEPLSRFLVGCAVVSFIAGVVALIIFARLKDTVSDGYSSESKREKAQADSVVVFKVAKWMFIQGVVSVLVCTFVPKERTGWLMVGAYATQRIAESPAVGTIGTQTLTLIEKKLESITLELTEEIGKKASKKEK